METVLDVHEIAQAVDPSVYERTRRVQYAMLLIRSGVCRHRIARMIADRYGIHRSTALAHRADSDGSGRADRAMTPAQERAMLAAIAVGVDADLQDAMQEILERIDAGQAPAAVVLGVLGDVTADFAAKMASGLSTVYGVDVTVQEVLARARQDW